MVHSVLAIALILTSINTTGFVAIYTLIAVGFCNSIMFPTIFTLAIKGFEKSAEKPAGLLATAIIGGAFIPLFTGQIADTSGLATSFMLSAACYAYIAFYGFKWR